jgi:hypothetical protein
MVGRREMDEKKRDLRLDKTKCRVPLDKNEGVVKARFS